MLCGRSRSALTHLAANLVSGLDKDKKMEEFRSGGGLPTTSALDRVKDFLPQLKQANDSEMKNMEDVNEGDKHIELNLYKPV